MRIKSILLIEDNPDDEELTLEAFRKGNIANQVVVVRDGAEALEYLFATGRHAGRELSDFPAVVLLDLKLPKVDGIEVLRRLRADPRIGLTPVVILTSSGEESDVLNGYRLHCNSYIRKPVNFEKFIDAVANVGLYWVVLNEPVPARALQPPAPHTQ